MTYVTVKLKSSLDVSIYFPTERDLSHCAEADLGCILSVDKEKLSCLKRQKL